jgi:hypothetical protein
MSSNRLIFLFLGIILLVVVILSSKRIATTLRGWFGKYIPAIQTTEFSPTPTPTVTPTMGVLSPTPTPRKNAFPTQQGSTPSSQIPATGPETVVWLLLGGGVTGGLTLRKLSRITSLKKN